MPGPRHVRAPAIGLVSALLLVALAMAVPRLTGWNVHVDFAPLAAEWRPRVGVGTLPAIAIAALAAWHAVPLAQRLSWRRLLLAAFVVGLLWMLALAFVDGPNGIGVVLTTRFEYLHSAHDIHDVHRMLEEYVARIPLHSPNHWPVHLAGHPPGAVLFFIALMRLGLVSGFQAGLAVTLIAATTSVAVLITMDVLGAREHARRVAPFLVLGPAAVWQCVSADAMFAGLAAWGVAALVMAATRARPLPLAAWALLAGLILGYCVMLSYGLPILAVLALVVLALAKNWRPLPYAVAAASGVVLLFAGLGFAWWAALPVLHTRYWDGVAGIRPGWYWNWGDLAALTLSAGPVIGAGVAVTITRLRDVAARVPVALTAAGVAMVLAADASQMSRAEVERIWLPFVPWLLVSTALLPARWRRPSLVVQMSTALVIQHLLATTW